MSDLNLVGEYTHLQDLSEGLTSPIKAPLALTLVLNEGKGSAAFLLLSEKQREICYDR